MDWDIIYRNKKLLLVGEIMTEQKKPTQEEKVACDVCLKEIPISEAMSEEATDYVAHFCGLDCYTKWKEQKKKEEG